MAMLKAHVILEPCCLERNARDPQYNRLHSTVFFQGLTQIPGGFSVEEQESTAELRKRNLASS